MDFLSFFVTLNMLNLSTNFREEFKNKRKKEEWRLFNAKDFQSLMYPCFTLCHILGIHPHKINVSTFEISKKLYYILSIVAICFYNIYVLIMLYNIPSYINDFPVYLIKYCALVLGDFIMIISIILTGPRTRLLQTILKISSRVSKSYQKLSRLIHTKDIIGFLGLYWYMFPNWKKLSYFKIMPIYSYIKWICCI